MPHLSMHLHGSHPFLDLRQTLQTVYFQQKHGSNRHPYYFEHPHKQSGEYAQMRIENAETRATQHIGDARRSPFG